MIGKDEGIDSASFITKMSNIDCPNPQEFKDINPCYSRIGIIHGFPLELLNQGKSGLYFLANKKLSSIKI